MLTKKKPTYFFHNFLACCENRLSPQQRSYSIPPVGFEVTARHAMRGSGSTEIDVREQGFWPIAHRIKQQHSFMNENIEYNERPPLSFPSVEFEVTARHAMRGSGSTKIVMMEEVNERYQHHSLSLPSVEFEVTARHAMRGSGSTEIVMMEEVNERYQHHSLSLPSVEFEVTAHHAMRGSGSTEIVMMEEVNERYLSPVHDVDVAKTSADDDELPYKNEQASLSIPPVELKVAAITSNMTNTINDPDDNEQPTLSLPPRGFQHVYKDKRAASSLRVRAAHKATIKHGPP
jgi:hypothetical protein